MKMTTRLLTAGQMRALEKAAMDSGRVTGRELMERAGRGVVQAVFDSWPDLAATDHHALVLCGPGNNGGDGFVVARLLKQAGWQVDLLFLGREDRLPPDARLNHDRWCQMGKVEGFSARRAGQLLARGLDLVVDGFFGTGLKRPIDAGLILPLEDDFQGRVVAIDIPSGLCADSGRALGGRAARADLTVTFHAAKQGHYLAEGPDLCGRLSVADIGIGFADNPALGGAVSLVDINDETISRLGKAIAQHKYAHGHALVLAGPMGRGGAARLAARGALRIGAGLVTLACPPPAMAENAAQLNAIMLRPYAGAQDVAALLEDRRLNAICLGPGLGLSAETRETVLAVLATQRPCVLDADALSVFRDTSEDLFEALHEKVVLTPHAGEFPRLFPDISARLNEMPETGPAYSRIDAASAAAARCGCVVLLKGPDTVIAAPDGKLQVNGAVYARAAPWLATAGAGDVLAGFVTGLLARGFDAHEAAAMAAWLHTECAREFGPGLIAEDLPEALPAVFRALGIT